MTTSDKFRTVVLCIQDHADNVWFSSFVRSVAGIPIHCGIFWKVSSLNVRVNTGSANGRPDYMGGV
ncbi:hypothetical protein Fuma_03305 [Fuerstiella marisgermanici]|uniref:Uncharacterized protein n=1 Tax=Fuerstiella marisgermanici TaxID=1891926 RepID=A0A1P8WI21_9PLAN|nr:hypothetical protein Fuma_03305 [Fuerstiella marisgermanici]